MAWDSNAVGHLLLAHVPLSMSESGLVAMKRLPYVEFWSPFIVSYFISNCPQKNAHCFAIYIQETDHERNSESYFFGSEDFGLNPIRTGSTQQSSFSQNNRTFNFDDSVPSTPLYNIGNSPPGQKDGSGPSFDSFSRFDSFRTYDSGFPSNDLFSRFDSMRSRDFDSQSHGFPPLDDTDPFGSSGPFRTSFDNQTPRKSSDSWNAF